MPKFTLHRDHLLRTTKGHTIRFEKDKPTYVPPVCIEDAVSIGAQAVNAKDGDIIPEEKVEVVLTQKERMTKIAEAFEVMVKRQERNDFTGNGLPNAKKLEALVGFEVHSKERDSAWKAFRVKLENPDSETEDS